MKSFEPLEITLKWVFSITRYGIKTVLNLSSIKLYVMKPNFTLTIPKPCHENWKDFTPTKRGGFCGSCQKEVIDFTSWSDEQIKQYFVRSVGSTCGRFKPRQLKSYQDPKTKPVVLWRLAAILTLVSLWFGKPSLAQTSKGKPISSWVDEKKRFVSISDTLISQIVITGQVKDDQGEALPGVNIVRKGTTLSTVSNAEGKFLLEINRPNYNEILVASFIGMVNTEVAILANTTKKEIAIVLQPDVMGLGETIMLGGVSSTGPLRRLWWKVRSVFSRKY